MKRILSLFLAVLTIVASISVQVYAKEKAMTSEEIAPSTIVKPKHMAKVEVNEYELYKELKKKSDQDLLKDGWSIEKIEEFKKHNYVETLKERSKLSKDQLKQMGYSNEKIDILKNNSTWSESQLVALASTCLVSFGVNYTLNSTAIWEFYSQWSWTTNPGFTGYDEVLGARWMGSTNGNTSMPTLTSSNFAINMIDTDGGFNLIATKYSSMSKVDLNAGQLKFKGYEIIGDHRTFPMSGYGTFRLDNSKAMERVTLSLKYGHTTSSFAFNPSIALSGTDLGFTFTFGTNEVAGDIVTFRSDGTIVQ